MGSIALFLTAALQLTPASEIVPRVRIRELAEDLARLVHQHPDGLAAQPIIVTELRAMGTLPEEQHIGEVTSAELAQLLAGAHGLFVLERARLDEILEELALEAQLGKIDDTQLASFAKKNGAALIVVGEVAELGGQVRIAARILRVGDASSLGQAAVEIPRASLVTYASESVILRSRTGALFRSMVIPGWGQSYNRQNTKAVLIGSSFGLVAASALALQLQGSSYVTRYRENTPGTVRFGDRAERLFSWRNTALWSALVVWGIAAVDAYFNGPDDVSSAHEGS